MDVSCCIVLMLSKNALLITKDRILQLYIADSQTVELEKKKLAK